MDRGGKPCSFDTALVKQALALFALGAEPQFPQGACVPARHKLALTAVFSVYRVAELDEVGMPADGLGERPLQAVGVVGAFGAAGAGVAVGGAVVRYGGGRQVVPPFARGALGEEGMRVREEGGVGEGFLLAVSVWVVDDCGNETHGVEGARPLPLPQILHLLGLELVQREQGVAPALAGGLDVFELVAGEGGVQGGHVDARGILDGVRQHSVAAGLLLDPVLVAVAQATLAGDVLGGGCLGRDELLHQALGEHEASAAIGKVAAVAALVRLAQVVRRGGVELAEQAEQRVPEEVDVRLEEDEPLGLGVRRVGLVDHGQVLEAVELEAALRLLDRLALGVGLLLLDVGLEVEVVDFVCLGQLGEDVDDVAVAQSLLAVADNDEVGDAARDGAEVGLGGGALARRDLEDDLDLVEQVLGEVLAVVELDAVCALGLERREEGLGLGLVHRRRVAWPRAAAVRQCVEEEEEQQRREEEAPWPASQAASQQLEHCGLWWDETATATATAMATARLRVTMSTGARDNG